MKLRDKPPLHLTYCMNVHAGDSWAEIASAIRTHAPAVRRRAAPETPFGLGLRLSHAASLDLERDPAALRAFQAFLEAHSLYVFTVNGFPYGRFHDGPVKDSVYSPDWRDPARRDYTLRLAHLLARLLDPGVPGSISTVPGSYRAWIQTDDDRSLVGRRLADTAAHLARLRDETGADICLALEPEPDCLLESTDDAVRFFEDHLLRDAGAAEADIRRHVGVCLDACHMAVNFEDPEQSLRTLTARGIRVAKVHLSAALIADGRPAALERLKAFCDPVYLHQVKIRSASGAVRSHPDLEPALRAEPADGDEWRIHFHVPLYFDGDGGLTSTNGLLTPSFFKAVTECRVPHLEIETYTFDVLPPDLRRLDVVESTAREYQWVLDRLPR